MWFSKLSVSPVEGWVGFPLIRSNDSFVSFKAGLFGVQLKIKLVLKCKRKKVTIHMACIVYTTFLICECDREELEPTYECDFQYQICCLNIITASKWICLIYYFQTELV